MYLTAEFCDYTRREFLFNCDGYGTVFIYSFYQKDIILKRIKTNAGFRNNTLVLYSFYVLMREKINKFQLVQLTLPCTNFSFINILHI